MHVQIRDLTPQDVPFLQEALYLALFWRPEEFEPLEGMNLTVSEILSLPQVNIFYRDWGRHGDAGAVAEVEGGPAGAAWYRLFTEAEHGEGYVDADTPELVIAVVERYRGQGIGRQLMEAMHRRALRAGIRRISLSVDPDNPAKRLYASLGYVDYQPNDANERMILDLSRDEMG